jgi:hypothetical protein
MEETMRRRAFPILQPAAVSTIAALSLALTACVLSIEPVIPESESTFEPALLGTWALGGAADTAVVGRDGKSGYLIDYTDGEGERGQFEGRVGRLGGRMLLEVTPTALDLDASDGYTSLFLPGRLLFVVMVRDGEILTTQLRDDSLKVMLRRGELVTPYLDGVDDAGDGSGHLLLTGTSSQLRTWLEQYLERSGVLADTAVWQPVERGER